MTENLLWFLLIQNLDFILLSIKLTCVGYVFHSCYFFFWDKVFLWSSGWSQTQSSCLQLTTLRITDVYMSYIKHVSYIHALLKTTSI